MSAAAATLAQDTTKLKEALTVMQSTLNDVKTFANDAKSYKESVQKKTSEAKGALDAVDLSEAEKTAESEAKEQASKAVKEALAGTDLTDDQKAEIQSKVKDSISISDTTDTASGKIAEAKDALKDMPDLEIPEFSLGTDTITVLVEDMQKQLQVLGQYSRSLVESWHTDVRTLRHTGTVKIRCQQPGLRQRSAYRRRAGFERWY